MLRDTGSRLNPRGIELYTRLWARSRHVGATLAMMAGWDLDALVRDLPALDRPLHLIVPGDDRLIPAEDAPRVRRLVPSGRTEALADLGHLAHEEQPERIADIVLGLTGRPDEADAGPAPTAGAGEREALRESV
jgi:magnesium chelatase accessory protein